MIKGLGSDMEALRLGSGDPKMVRREYRFTTKSFNAGIAFEPGDNAACDIRISGDGKTSLMGLVHLDALDQLILDLQNVARCARQLSNGAADKDDAVEAPRRPLKPYTLDEIKALHVGAEMYYEKHLFAGEFYIAEKHSDETVRVCAKDGSPLMDLDIDKGLTGPYFSRLWPPFPKPTWQNSEAVPWEEQNRVLTLQEALALPIGARVYLESRENPSHGGMCRVEKFRDSTCLRDAGGYGWTDWKTAYNHLYRCWSDREPTADESAAVPWKDE